MAARHDNNGLRKLCDGPRRNSANQTRTYLNVEKTGLQDSRRRFGVPAGCRCNSVVIPL
jgi:hypothetical protein